MVALAVTVVTLINPLMVNAAALPPNFVSGNRNLPSVVANVLPVPRNPLALTQSGVIPGVESMTSSSGSLVINQNQPRTVIDWKSFNIGANAWVNFKQQSGWVALNRIQDTNPTQIYGRLQADGTVYLINQNGILFAPGSQVNVHSLIASTLNLKMTDSAFFNPATAVSLIFKGEGYQTDSSGVPVPFDPSSAVSNLGSIKTDDQGSVFLLAPRVENAGTISTPMGQTGLVAGTAVAVMADSSDTSSRTALIAKVNSSPGLAVNQQGGMLEADNGMVGMYGGTVRQEGIIRSVTAVKVNGQIELKASNLVQTGVNSRTETPPDTSGEKIHQSFPYNGGSILVGGLDSDDPAIASTSVRQIDHQGAIVSPSGRVTMNASERTTLEAGSAIDVSGAWQDKPSSDRLTSVMLSSVVLRDAQLQKNGALKGQTVTVDPLTGSSIGDISGSLTSRELSTLDRSVSGGMINIAVPAGDIIARQGASLLFAGGGFRYGSGASASSWLVSGNNGYPLSTSPSSLWYSLIGSSQTFSQEKWGVTKSYSGLYLGGSMIGNYVSDYSEGANAGTFSLAARRVDLYGHLDGSVTRGYYQNLAAELTNSLGQQITLGRAEPAAGTLTIGVKPLDDPTVTDMVTDAIVVRQSVPAEEHNIPVAGVSQESAIASSILNAAGLGAINLYANNTVVIDRGARIAMSPGASFTGMSRRIEQRGEIDIPGGSVTLKTVDNKSPFPNDISGRPLVSEIYVDAGSSINVAGTKTDLRRGNSNGLPATAHMSGGSVTIQDDTDAGAGVILRAGSSVDVGGGYLVDTTGKISSANAGTIALQGDALIVDGNLHGEAIQGNNGGTIILHAGSVEVTPGAVSPLPVEFDATSPLGSRSGTLLLNADRFVNSGFTTLDMRGRTNLVVDSGSIVAPSTVRLTAPDTSGFVSSGAYPKDRVVAINPASSSILMGASAVNLSAGVVFAGRRADATGNLVQLPATDTRVVVADGAMLSSGPGGQVSITNDAATLGQITVAGTLDAPGGRISIRAGGDVQLMTGSRLLAPGYVNPATPASSGILTTPTLLPGGTISVKSNNRDFIAEQGSLIDVSAPGVVTVPSVTSGMALGAGQLAGDPGAVSLSFGRNVTLAGDIRGLASVTNGRGATFSLVSANDSEGLGVTPRLVSTLVANGFDAMILGSRTNVTFGGSMDVSLGRSLTLNTPEIRVNNTDSVAIKAPWITLSNNQRLLNAGGTKGGGTLLLAGEWIDLSGQVAITGISSARLEAAHDIRLYDTVYATTPTGGINEWHGSFLLGGDLTLAADRIYPGMQTRAMNVDPVYNPTGDQNFVPSAYAITSGGKVTTLRSDQQSDQPIYSAGGSVTINAMGGIEHHGNLAAPLGTINLNTDPSYGSGSRVYLSSGGIVTTAGASMVPYGYMDADQQLNVLDKKSGSFGGIVTSRTPGKSVGMGGNEVIVSPGATIDVSGGGSVFSYQFQPGIEGSFNPLTVKGRSVILPGNPLSGPGDAVYLNGVSGIASGMYTILPEQYAFLPGALVITDLGALGAGNAPTRSKEGYPATTGYATVAGTGIMATQLHSYSVRNAQDLLKEGNFSNYRSIEAGNGGDVTVSAATAILNGAIKAAPLPDDPLKNSFYQGGKLSLSGPGTSVTVTQTSDPLPPSTTFGSPLGAYEGTIAVDSVTMNGGFSSVELGKIDPAGPAGSTKIVTINENVAIHVPVISLAGADGVTLAAGGRIDAVGNSGNGTATVTTGGTLTLSPTSQIHASDRISIDTAAVDFQGLTPLKVDHGAVSLASDRLYVTTDSYMNAHPNLGRSLPGLYLSGTIWNSLNESSAVSLNGRKEMTFLGDVTLSARTDIPLYLTLDSARLSVQDPGEGGVTVTSTRLNLTNTSSLPTLAASDSAGVTGAFNLVAGDMLVSLNASDMVTGLTDRRGDLIFSGFGKVNLTATNDLTLAGVGRFMTGGGDISLTAARVTATFYKDATTPYRSADLVLDAGNVGIYRSAGTAGSKVTPGGKLRINANTIDQSGTVQVDAGVVSYSAQGDIAIRPGAEILAHGIEYPAGSDGVKLTDGGGTVQLSSAGGAVAVAAGARVDVSAAGAGDAGSIIVLSPAKGVKLAAGTLAGRADGGGDGGSLTIQTADLSGFTSGFSGLNSTVLAPGGFTKALDIRTRLAGSLTVAADDLVVARAVTLAVDGGDLAVQGAIDASGKAGGRVELYAGGNLTLSGTIDAHATAADVGGTVILSTGSFDSTGNPAGRVNLAGGAIDVSGTGSGSGGSVTIRAPRTATTLNSELKGSINGADKVIAEAFKIYDLNVLDAAAITALQNDTRSYMNVAGVDASGLTLKGGSAQSLQLRPGIEVRSSGNLTLSSTWDLTSWRYGGLPGNLTLRAAGDLDVAKSLLDTPTKPYLLFARSPRADGWNFALAAGGDPAAANPLAIRVGGSGSMVTFAGEAVYTERGNINFASGEDTVLNAGRVDQGSAMRYSLATSTGEIRGDVGGALLMKGTATSQAAVQSATGNITLSVGGDVNLLAGSGPGAIRTTGVYDPSSSGSTEYWKYSGGGNVTINAGGSITAPVAMTAWDAYGVKVSSGKRNYFWSARYETRGVNATTAGVATMAGGNLTLRGGGDMSGQFGVFGAGKLSVLSGGNLGGRLLVGTSDGIIRSMGNMGSEGAPAPLLETSTARVTVVSQGDMLLGSISNPTVSTQGTGDPWNLTYSPESATDLISRDGSIRLNGDTVSWYGRSTSTGSWRTRILPPLLSLDAAGDIVLAGSFALAPSPSGNVVLKAGGTISGAYQDNGVDLKGQLIMSDTDPTTVYGRFTSGQSSYATLQTRLFDPQEHNAGTVAQRLDLQAATLVAGGDIGDMIVAINRRADITAAGDIKNLTYYGQNNHESFSDASGAAQEEVTTITAGGNISFSAVTGGASLVTGIFQGGPGALDVQAGGDINLGSSRGIQSYGNAFNGGFDSKGSDLTIVTGMGPRLDLKLSALSLAGEFVALAPGQDQSMTPRVQRLFDTLRYHGQKANDLKSAGDSVGSRLELDAVHALVAGLYDVTNPSPLHGNLNMTSSQISTNSGADAVNILSGGVINVGKSTIVLDRSKANEQLNSTGIYTANGGPINILAVGDVNVNESRVMTFRGGDITAWSDQGGLNAGRGSRTAITASPPKKALVPGTGVKNPDFNGNLPEDPLTNPLWSIPPAYTVQFSPPAVGSGIAAKWYNKGLTAEQANIGNIYLYAPNGYIDAGEAGIVGGSVYINTPLPLNVQNITSSGGNVPSATGPGVSLGSLSGAGSVAQATKSMEQAASVAGAGDQGASLKKKIVEELFSFSLDVRVISFDTPEIPEPQDGPLEKKTGRR